MPQITKTRLEDVSSNYSAKKLYRVIYQIVRDLRCRILISVRRNSFFGKLRDSSYDFFIAILYSPNDMPSSRACFKTSFSTGIVFSFPATSLSATAPMEEPCKATM